MTDTTIALREATDPRLAGTKAATLAALAAQGFPVPDGIVVPAGAHFESDMDGVVAALVDAVRPWGDVALAVRSSAVDEDLPDASYAGLYTSVLGVRGEQALGRAVRRCWASAFADRVSSYARCQPRMAVLVQPMVPADSAGVAFTADPVTGERGVVVIDAVPGLAERLVSGAATPERWVVRHDRATREPGAGAALDTAHAFAVAELARRVERSRGTPQDVEWAVVDADVVLLQARPITALPDPPVPLIPVPVEVPGGFWTRERSHAPLPWTRLSHAILEARMPAIRAAVGEHGLLVDGVEVRDIGGLEYLRVVPLGGKEPPRLPGWAVLLASRLVPSVRRRICECVAAIRADVPMRLVRRWSVEWRPELEERIATLRDVDLRKLDDERLDGHAESVLALARDGCMIHFRLNIALTMVLSELGFACRDLLGWDDRAWLRLVTGSSTRSTEPARALARLASHVAAHPRLRALVDRPNPVATVLAHDPEFAAGFTAYLREYGCRALDYELAEPAFDERPELAIALLREQLAAGYDPAVRERELACHRAIALAEARSALTGVGRDRFETALERALVAYPVREDNQFLTGGAPGALVRRTVLEIGRRLASRDQIADPGDAFHLRPDELRAALLDGGELHDLIVRRAGERAWAVANPGPPSYGTPPPPPPSPRSLPAEARFANEAFLWLVERILGPSEHHPGEKLAGVAASPGSYSGAVRVIHDETEFNRLRAGDVMVCPMTAPSWSVLFPIIGGLVTDAGGTLSHPAIIAREYAIPAVVATGDATRRLRDGQLVTVDGTTGLVRVLP